MPVVFSRGRIAGMGMMAFLLGVALVTVGLLPFTTVMFVGFLLVVGGVSLALARSPRSFVRSLCLLTFCLGVFRSWNAEVPSLDLLYPAKTMRTASRIRVLREGQIVPLSFVRIRKKFTEEAQHFLPSEEAALLTGILYGEHLFSPVTQKTFRRAGLMHIVAVSGANISVIILVLSRLILRLGCSRRCAWTVLTVGIALFVLFVTPAASVVRAAIMGILGGLAPLVGRLARSTRLLLVAGILFVFWQPSALLLDAGFVLSFLAMLGLIILGPMMDEEIPAFVPRFLRETVVSTFAATLMTAPYLAWSFHSLSLLGLVSNLFIVPLVPWIMLFGAVALGFPVHAWIFLPVRGLLSLLLWLAHLTDQTSWGVWDRISFSWMWMMVYYIVLFCLYRLYEQRKRLMHRQSRKCSN